MCPEDDQPLSDLEEWPGIWEQSHPNPIPDTEPNSYDSDWESEPKNNKAEFAWDEKPPVQDWRGNPYAVIVDISGIHHLTVQYCQCDGHKPDDEQMLELGFFRCPSNGQEPSLLFDSSMTLGWTTWKVKPRLTSTMQ
jgi:hypothetical protein